MSEKYWLLKTEPETFSIDDLKNSPKKTTTWEGVRNYQARNMIRDEMSRGDLVFIYHSVKDPGIAGIGKIVREGYPDHFAWDPTHKYFDPKTKQESPTWFMIDVQLVKKFRSPLSLSFLREQPGLEGMELLRKGSRLSVQPVRKKEWDLIVDLAE